MSLVFGLGILLTVLIVTGGTGASVDDYAAALAGAVLIARKSNWSWDDAVVCGPRRVSADLDW